MNAALRTFGQRLRRREDPALLSGTASYLADLITPDMSAMHVIRASVAHARITAIDFSGVRDDPRCLGVLSAQDLPSGIGALPALDLLERSAPVHQGVLARNIVRYIGEPVAVVLAADAYVAEDLAERVRVDYEAMPAVLDVRTGAEPDATLLYPALGSNIVHETSQSVGDPDAAFAAAAHTLCETFSFQRVTATPMEARGAIAGIDPDCGRYVLHSSTQIPQLLRAELARILCMDAARLRVIAPHIGGGFGCKEAVYPEEVLLLLALQRFGRAVYWCEDRAEHFSATVHGREEHLELRAALSAEGIITAVEAQCLADIGAAYALFGNTPGAALATVRGPYRIPNFRSRARSVVTNKTPLNVYRGAGYPQATLAMERMMDLAAAATGLDRAEIRRRNLLQPDAFPADRGVSYPGCGRVIFDSGNFPALLDSTLEAIGYEGFDARRVRAARPADPGCAEAALALGVGLAFVVEMTSGGGAEPARVRAGADGRLQLLSGITPIGQGSATTLTQILADHLGIAPDLIDFVAGGDTDSAPHAPGTFASRGATMGGNAACRAADAFVRQTLNLAAALSGTSVNNLRWERGVIVQTQPPRSWTLQELVQQSASSGLSPLDRLDTTARFDDDRVSFASACHAAVVQVDCGTGVVRVLEYAVTHDCGRIANPLLVDGQIMGGVLQGLGGCLFEAVEYGDTGTPRTKGYMDYVLPTAANAPRFVLRHIETPSPLNPLGMKGAGEAGCSGAGAAIVNAIAHALGSDAPESKTKLPGGSGPFTPPVILRILNGAEAGAGMAAQAREDMSTPAC